MLDTLLECLHDAKIYKNGDRASWFDGDGIAEEIKKLVEERYIERGKAMLWEPLASIEDARKEVNRVAANKVFDMHVTVDVALSWLDEIEREIAERYMLKPRTIEDVLRDVWKEALDYAKSDMWRNPDEVFVERADEIRELLGGDAK